MLTITRIARQTNTRASGTLSDGTPFEIIKHLGSGRCEIRHANGIGKARKYNTLTTQQRMTIAAHPIAALVYAADIYAGEGSEE